MKNLVFILLLASFFFGCQKEKEEFLKTKDGEVLEVLCYINTVDYTNNTDWTIAPFNQLSFTFLFTPYKEVDFSEIETHWIIEDNYISPISQRYKWYKNEVIYGIEYVDVLKEYHYSETFFIRDTDQIMFICTRYFGRKVLRIRDNSTGGSDILFKYK